MFLGAKLGKFKDIEQEIEEKRLEVGLKVHEEAYRKAGLDISHPDLQQLLYDKFWEHGFRLMDIDPQEIIDEFKLKNSTLWKTLNK